MATLKPLMEIHVPSPKAEVVYETVLFDRRFAFKGLKRLLGAADYEKAGDRLAGVLCCVRSRKGSRAGDFIRTEAEGDL